MAKTVQPAVTHVVILKGWDPSGETTVTIREARHGEETQRERALTPTVRERLDASGITREYTSLPLADLAYLECWLTFVDATILTENQGQMTRLFQPGMSEVAFRHAFAQLPPELVSEWQQVVTKINPHWNI
jgi:hypothetical protein